MSGEKSTGTFEFSPIGFVESPFHDKFGIPRQPGLVLAAKGVVKIKDTPDLKTALRTLEEFSHIWIVFVFHEHGGKNWKPSIRPPRLGGARRVGVLSSRSPHRPNPIGLSAVRLDKVDIDAEGGPELHVSGIDLLDGTPVLDIKPYIAYADSIPDADAGWASSPIRRNAVTISPLAEGKISQFELKGQDGLRDLIVEVLTLDPRPASQASRMPVDAPESLGLKFGIDILESDVRYEITADGFYVSDVVMRTKKENAK